MAKSPGARVASRRIARSVMALLAGVAVVGSAAGCDPATSASAPASTRRVLDRLPSAHPPARRNSLPTTIWPTHGQAAFVTSVDPLIHASPNQRPAPIASVAKVMTGYLVLRDHPLDVGEDGPTITLTDADVDDTARRRARGESIVAVTSGEQLTEVQALQALLLPSANNIAIVLGRWDAGSVQAFVDEMNATARSLGMAHTRYTDPSGYEDATVSTAEDQLRIAEAAMRSPVFARIVATASVSLPVAGTVRNTDRLLGDNGFVGIKTGSDSAAGGCFAFRSQQLIDGRQVTVTGVVLGQRGTDLLTAGLVAGDAFVDRIAGRRPRDTTHLRLPAQPAPGPA